MSISLVHIIFMFFLPLLAVGIDDCMPTYCRKGGPKIQFPFRLKNRQPECFGYPGFDLYCDKSKETVLVLPSSVELLVKKIDYASQQVHLYDPERCLPQKLPHLNLTASPFHFPDKELYAHKLFNCSALDRDLGGSAFDIHPGRSIPCLGVPGYQVYAIPLLPDELSYLTSCTKICTIKSIPGYILDTKDLHLNWTEPACGHCEAQGRLCSLNITANHILCTSKHKTKQGSSKSPLIAAGLGSFLLVVTLAALYHLYISTRAHKENQLKIEKFLEDYEALKPSRFSYADIRRITNEFNEKLGEGGYGIVYKGKLSHEIYVAVKVLNNSKGNGEEFVNEVGTIGTIHHVNVVRLVGFCADGFRRALVYEFLQNDSLEKFIFLEGPKRKSLDWEKLQDIALGIAKGIEYLHQGCDQQILHFDIKPQNILLDHNFNPKICDFGLAKLCAKEKSAVSMTVARGTMGYIAPEVLTRTFGRVSHKSDVYSFGMLLLEMVGGRKNVDNRMNTSQVYFPQWIYHHLNQEEILVQIEEGDQSRIMRKLTIVGLWCIQWHPADRPSIKAVVQMLEGDGENLTMPPNPFPATNVANSVSGPYQTELAIISE